MLRIAYPPLPSARRRTQFPSVRLRRYPRPRPGPMVSQTGLFVTGSLSRAVRVSSPEERTLRGISILGPVSVQSTCVDTDKCVYAKIQEKRAIKRVFVDSDRQRWME